MDTSIFVVTLVILLAIVALGAWIWMQKRRSEELRKRFGPEYGRVVEAAGNCEQAEKELAERQKRVEAFHLRALPPDEREPYAERWRFTQAQFVDEPQQAIEAADRLVT